MPIARKLLIAVVVAAAAALCGCREQPPPGAQFSATPINPAPGESVTLHVTSPCSGHTGYVQWDLDGDGKYDQTFVTYTACAAEGDATHTYAEAGDYAVSSAVTDYYPDADEILGEKRLVSGYSTQHVVVAPLGTTGVNRPPLASFTTDADPAAAGHDVRFDATGSSDADGQITRYEWDWESDGSYDATGVEPKHHYADSGTYEVTLRVTDNKGAQSTTQRAVSIVDAMPATPPVGTARAGTPMSIAMSGTMSDAGDTFVNRGVLFHPEMRAHGTMRLAGMPEPLSSMRRVKWASRFVLRQRNSRGKVAYGLHGYLLIDAGHGNTACFAGGVNGSAAKGLSGSLRLVGGSGTGRHASGSVTVSVPATGGKLEGHATLRRARAARSLPHLCRALR